ncbi:MAG: leucine-rich repeat protein [Bacteroidaceae bacterium]|nr:leucine-rich repeat protein [Bacteroidaceae bacterium]
MKYRVVFSGILASALFIGCSENEALMSEPVNRHEMQVEANIRQEYATRVNDTGFAMGDAIGIYVVDYKDGKPCALANSGNHADNVKFTLGQDGWSSVTHLYWTDKKTAVDAYSYYPFMESVSDVTSVPFVVERRQDTGTTGELLGGYEKSDFLWAKATGAQPLSPIILRHQHLMAGIQLSLIEGEGFNGEWASLDKAVAVTNTKLSSHINLQTGVVTVDDADTLTSIIPYRNGNEWRCVVVPQAVDAGKELIQIVIDGDLYSFTRSETTVYQAGKLSKFAIKVDKREKGDYEFTLVSESVVAWENDAVSHQAEAKAYITVHVPQAGGLKAALDEANLNYKDITNLKLTGVINNDDFQFMLSYLMYLEALNLKEVKTVECLIEGQMENDVIPDDAFYEQWGARRMPTLKYIVFPDNLKKIGRLAFRGTSLCHDIILPEGLTYVGDGAFDNTDVNDSYGYSSDGLWYTHTIRRISLPSTLTHIGTSAFAECPIEQELSFPEKIDYLGEAVFESCKSITGELRIPQNLTTIGRKCFYENIALKGNLDVPASVTEVGIGAFARTGFSSLTLHEGLKTIRAAAFSGIQVLYESQVWEDGYSDLYPFDGDLVLPSTVTIVERYAFANTGFKHVYLPDNFEEIPEGLFSRCKELIDTVVIPSKVNHIGSNAFSDCERLTAVVLPKNLLSIGENCFRNCFSLDYLQCLSETPPVLEGSGHFDGVAKDNFTLVVPQGCVDAYRNAPGWGEFKRISEYRNFVCRPQRARLLNKGNVRDIVLNADGAWTVTHCPNWAHVSQTFGQQKTKLTVTIDALPQGSGNRTDSIVFCLDGDNHTTCYKIEQYDSPYDEDASLTLQSAQKGKGINLVFIGDGYDAKDIAEGVYLTDMKQQVEYFFDVEPYKTYRDYFNVYTAFAMSYESGIGTLNTLRDVKFNTMTVSSSERITTDFDEALFYAVDHIPVDESDIDALTCVLTPNTTIYDGITRMWPGARGGAAVALCPKSEEEYPYDARGLVQHEAGGHGFGKLADEYIYHAAWIQTCRCSCCEHVDGLMQMQAQGWGENLSLDGKYISVPWKHLVNDNRFNDITDIYEGGYFHSRGVYRSEQNSCMNNNVPYYSTWCRELIVRRIKMLAGETFSFDDFVANDSREWGQDFTKPTRSSQQIHTFVNAPRHGHAPLISASEPERPVSK